MSDDRTPLEQALEGQPGNRTLSEIAGVPVTPPPDSFDPADFDIDELIREHAERTMIATATKPDWADTEHAEGEGYTWSRETLEHHSSDGMDYVPGVTLFCSVGLHSDGEGTVSMKQDAPLIYLGGDPITPETARRVRDGLTEALRLLDE